MLKSDNNLNLSDDTTFTLKEIELAFKQVLEKYEMEGEASSLSGSDVARQTN